MIGTLDIVNKYNINTISSIKIMLKVKFYSNIRKEKFMIKVIETNLSLDSYDNIVDHQSRVIEVESWEKFINEIKECKSMYRNSILGCLDGCSIPRESKVVNLKYDNIHLSCDVYNYIGMKSKKLVYKGL